MEISAAKLVGFCILHMILSSCHLQLHASVLKLCNAILKADSLGRRGEQLIDAIFTLLATAPALEQLEMRQCWLTSTFTVTTIAHMSSLRQLVLEDLCQPIRLAHLNHILRGLPLLERLRLSVVGGTPWNDEEGAMSAELAIPWPAAVHGCTRLTCIDINATRNAPPGPYVVNACPDGPLPPSIGLLERLATLSLRGGNAVEVAELQCLATLTRLELLDRYAMRVVLPQQLSGVTGLRELALSCDRIPEVVPALRLEALTLHLLGNAPFDAFGVSSLAALTSLTRLRLSECGVWVVPSLEGLELPALKVLMLDNNQLTSWPNLHAEVAGRLRVLCLSANHIAACNPPRIEALRQIETLDLSYTHLDAFPGLPPGFHQAVVSSPLLSNLCVVSREEQGAQMQFIGALLRLQADCASMPGRVPLTVHANCEHLPEHCADDRLACGG